MIRGVHNSKRSDKTRVTLQTRLGAQLQVILDKGGK